MDSHPPSAPLFNAFMQDLAKQLVPIVVEHLKAQTQAEGMGMIALDPNNISLPVYTVIKQDDNVRDLLYSMIDDHYNDHMRSMGTKLDELENKVDDIEDKYDTDVIDDMKGEIATLEEKVGELEENRGVAVDADDSDFQDIIRSVLRNHII